ncbi:MAG: MFS transporter [Hyphomicrobiaceae bacterium]
MQPRLTAIAGAVRRPFFRAVAGLGATQLIGWGTSFSAIPIFGTPIAADLNLAREWVFGGITVMLLVSALVAPRAGKLVDRVGARPLMVVGSLAAATAMLWQSLAWNLPSYLFGWVLIGIATPMMLGNAAMPGLVQVVGPNARSAITSLMLISGLTSTIFLPLNALLLATIGWRSAYIVFALTHLLICAPLHWLALKPDATTASPPPPLPATPAQPSARSRSFPPEGLLPEEQRRKAFVLLSAWMCAEGLITWGLYLQIIDILTGLGLTSGQAIAVWAIVGPCQAMARFVELMSGGRHSILTTSLGAALGVSFSFLALLPFGVSVPTATVFCICVGLGHGLFAIARNTLPLALFGSKEFGSYIGRLTVPQNICNAIAPVLFAAILSRFSAVGTLWISAIASWIGLVSVIFLVRFCRAAMKERGIHL